VQVQLQTLAAPQEISKASSKATSGSKGMSCEFHLDKS